VNQAEIMDVLVKQGALLEGHFQLSSGKHSDRYVQKQRVFEQPRIAASLANVIVQHFSEEAPRFDTVVSPAVGAIGFGTLVAYEAKTRFLFTEKVEGLMQFRRAQHLERGEKVLIVEDVVTTGGSAKLVVDAVQAAGADLVGVAALVDRSNIDLPFTLFSLLKVEVADFEPAECPMCEKGLAMDSPGSTHLRA
jgi:orotate phosphoribosyltransferase